MLPTRTAASSKVRVFIVDDHPIVRRGLQLLLGMEPDLKVCGEADSAPAALQKILALKPDVAVVDLGLKGGSGLELIKQLRAQDLKLKLLVFSMRDEGIYAERALRAGADGYITKEEGTEKAIEAIRVLMRGKRYLSASVAEKMMDSLAGDSPEAETAVESLSDRELEVLELLGEGLGSREIAEKLHLSIKTVESHREHIKAKLGLSRATELVSYAFNWFHGERAAPRRKSGRAGALALTRVLGWLIILAGGAAGAAEAPTVFPQAVHLQHQEFGTPELIRNEVRERFQALGPGGGFIFCTAHNIQVDTPLTNIEALFEAYGDIGRY